MSESTVAIVGAGFSGTLLALHLLRHCPSPTQVVLIERSARFGGGQAYSTGNASHLLNVPAGRMSAFHDSPLDFLEWLRAQPPCSHGTGDATPGCFVSRRSYGAYVRDLLKRELRRPELGNRLTLVRGEATRLAGGAGPVELTLDRDRRLSAGIVVLAVGNLAPEPPHLADARFYDGPLYRPDPWAPDALEGLDPNAPVLLIGTGLTMVDMVVSLLDRGHQGRIHALSRRGLLPRRHASASNLAVEAPALPTRLVPLLRAIRQAARNAGPDAWQGVIDGLRPFTVDLWQVLSLEDRQRFLRHLRRWWDVHRHRMAPAVAERLDAARAGGQLEVHAGWLRKLVERPDGRAQATYLSRGNGRPEQLSAARVINCAGPSTDYARVRHPLVRSLLGDGLVRPDPLRLGLDVTGSCATLNREGAISRRLFAAGPITKGAFWEITAVPDIRRQCEALAMHVAALVRLNRAVATPSTLETERC